MHAFSYLAQARRPEKDFAAYAKIARDRGREVMLAVATELPTQSFFATGCTPIFCRSWSMDSSLAGLVPTHPCGCCRPSSTAGGKPLPPKLMIIDGNQIWPSYRATDRRPISITTTPCCGRNRAASPPPNTAPKAAPNSSSVTACISMPT